MKRKVRATQFPKNSICTKYIETIDFNDSYKVRINTKDFPIENIYISIFSHSPKWINSLFLIRNKIVSVFGLDTGNDANQLNKDTLKAGSKIGIFKIYEITENEIIAGEDDKHLNFRVSVLKQNYELFISTLVHYNNWFGKAYFLIVKPFHKVVVKALLNNAVKENRI